MAAFAASAALCAQEPREDNPLKRQEWFMKGRTLKGESSAELRMRAYRQKLALRAKREQQVANRDPRVTPPFTNLIWTSLGPSPIDSDPTGNQSYGDVTGRVSAIAVDRTDSTGNTVYVGAASGGVWKSTNAASATLSNVTWTPLTDQQPSLAVGSIAIQPGNPSVILVGTGEGNNSADSYYGIGFLRSTDAGQTWTAITTANNGTRPLRGLAVEQIAFSTVNSNLVVAATASSVGASNGAEIQGGDGRGLYYSTDAGVTWSYANVTDPGGIPVAAGSTSAVVFNPIHNRFYAVMRFHGIYQSQDAQNWTRMSDPGTAVNTTACTTTVANFGCPLYRGSIAVNQTTGETFLVYVDGNGNFAPNGPGIYRLTGVNGTWSAIADAGSLSSCGDGAGCGSTQGTYNIYLRAVPRSGSSELYLGFVNIFSCTLTTNAVNCNWKNLTHVYGCSPFANPSHVHPDQHAFDFGGANNNVMYFGNDGGVYRALNGTSVSNGSCTATNPFQNLNANLGSFSQIVNFAQHPTDPTILLAGLQDNGSPLLHPLSYPGTKWKGINAGDGGFNAIDPANPNTYFTTTATNSGTVIDRCTQGSNCANNSSQTTVVTSAKYSGDETAFYMPFMLDPADTSRIILGTCRVWRGSISGPTLTASSNNFSTSDSTPCGGSDSKIRALAAGGPSAGSSANVIYAATESAPDAPAPGHIFTTANAVGGVTSWADRTGNINRSEFDISSVAVSPHDASGQTAYITIMGFGASHVWKTTNAGATWIDRTADLPDAPANAIVVDPTNPDRLFVGTDIGVFVSVDDGASWAELGTGLPTVVVSDLKIFNSGGVQRLRAATYGRGVWDIALPGALGLTFSANTLNFNVLVGSALQRTLTVTNSTTGNVEISGVSISGNFTKDTGCSGVTLAPGASCSVTVTFGPAAQGTYPGTLVFTDTATGSPHSVTLIGNSLNVSLTLVRPPRPHRPGLSQSAARTPQVSMVIQAEGAPDTSTIPLTLSCRAIRGTSACSLSNHAVELNKGNGYAATVGLELRRTRSISSRLGRFGRAELVEVTVDFLGTSQRRMLRVEAAD